MSIQLKRLQRCTTVSYTHLIFLISGILPLVPGAGIYWASYYAVTGHMAKAFDTGLTALKVAIAIVLGIVFVFELPQKLFCIGTRKS